MTDRLLLKDEIETFLFQEADFCDSWKLAEWLALWAEGEIAYQIGPLDTPDGDLISQNDMLYLVSDNRFRLEQRIIRLQKPTAHAEWPIRSRLRHSYTNVRNIVETGNSITFRTNMLVARTRRDTEGVSVIPGYVVFKLERHQGVLKIREKRIFLDLHMLSKPGTMALII